MVAPFRKLFSFTVTISLLLTAFYVSANQPSLGGSQWCFGKDNITGRIDLKPRLFSQIKGIKEGHYDSDSITDQNLQMATAVLQTYIDEKLSIAVNNKTYPVNVDKVTKNVDNSYSIWLSVNNVRFDHSVNPVKIVYSLLFKETKNAHTNLAFGYVTDAKGAALKKVIDYSPPTFQTTFAPNATAWEVSIKGSLPAAGNKGERSIKP